MIKIEHNNKQSAHYQRCIYDTVEEFNAEWINDLYEYCNINAIKPSALGAQVEVEINEDGNEIEHVKSLEGVSSIGDYDIDWNYV